MILNFFGVGVAKQKTVGIIIASWLIGKVVGVESCNDRVMKANVVIGDVV